MTSSSLKNLHHLEDQLLANQHLLESISRKSGIQWKEINYRNNVELARQQVSWISLLARTGATVASFKTKTIPLSYYLFGARVVCEPLSAYTEQRKDRALTLLRYEESSSSSFVRSLEDFTQSILQSARRTEQLFENLARYRAEILQLLGR